MTDLLRDINGNTVGTVTIEETADEAQEDQLGSRAVDGVPAVRDQQRPANTLDPPAAIFRNSRYQVTVYVGAPVEPFGEIAHLSFKVHDRQPWHDWRDMQRIKNELCGPECEAVEVFPAESRLVDSANQYHLFVFQSYTLPFGFRERLVGDADWQQSKQRPFPADARPADCMSAEDYDAALQRAIEKAAATRRAADWKPGDVPPRWQDRRLIEPTE
jgi:hypothetical protein